MLWSAGRYEGCGALSNTCYQTVMAPVSASLLDALGVRFLGEPAEGPDGWRERAVSIEAAAEDAGAHPGVAATLLTTLPVSRSGLAVTGVGLRIVETIPTAEPLLLRTRRRPGGGHDAEVALHDRIVAEGEVEIAGYDPIPRVPDLVELATVPFGQARPDHRCDVFDDRFGINRDAAWQNGGRVALPWVAEDLLDDGSGRAHPLGVAFLECVARIAAGAPPGASTRSLYLRFFADMPVLEPIRLVGSADTTDADTWQARAAAVDEEGVVYVTAAVEARRVRLTDEP